MAARRLKSPMREMHTGDGTSLDSTRNPARKTLTRTRKAVNSKWLEETSEKLEKALTLASSKLFFLALKKQKSQRISIAAEFLSEKRNRLLGHGQHYDNFAIICKAAL